MTLKTSFKHLIQVLNEFTPGSVKYLLRKMGFDKLQSILFDKYDVELAFQRKWAKEFQLNKSKFFEYWKNIVI